MSDYRCLRDNGRLLDPEKCADENYAYGECFKCGERRLGRLFAPVAVAGRLADLPGGESAGVRDGKGFEGVDGTERSAVQD